MLHKLSTQKIIIAAILLILPLTPHQAVADGVLCNERDYLATLDELGFTNSVVTIDDITYTSGLTSFHTIDVSDSNSPEILGSFETTDHIRQFTVVNNVAYLASDSAGLQILDISNPAAPTLVSSLNIPGGAQSVAVLGSIAYITDSSNELQIIDVSDSQEPVMLNAFVHSSPLWRTIISGTSLFASSNSELLIIDLSNPTEPSISGTYNAQEGNVFRLVASEGAMAYVMVLGTTQNNSEPTLEIVDISNPSSPSKLSTYDIDLPGGITVIGTTIYIATGHDGLEVIDASDPTSPRLLNKYLKPSSVYEDVCVVDNIAYVADSENGLHIIDVSDQELSSPLYSTIETPNFLREWTTVGNTLFVADHDSGMLIYDISDPTNPTLTSTYTDSGRVSSVFVSETTAYLGTGEGLHIVDVSNPEMPTFLGTYEHASLSVNYLNMVGTTSYFYGSAQNDYRLCIADLSDPQSPTLLSTHATSSMRDLTVVGTNAYYITSHSLYTVDVSDPLTPVQLGFYTHLTPNSTRLSKIEVSGTIAYITDDFYGLHLVDISNPSSPTLLNSIQIDEFPRDVAVVNNTAYLVDNTYGLRSYDTEFPTLPVLTGSYKSPNSAFAISVENSIAVISDFTDDTSSMIMLDVSDCPPLCPADLTNDEDLNFLDISAFLSAFSSTDPIADFNQDGSFNFLDISEFLNAFAAGCP